jgi:uncharacterized membrane protein YkvA (DUF1232 family)
MHSSSLLSIVNRASRRSTCSSWRRASRSTASHGWSGLALPRLLERLVPTVRTLISLPAGMARMPLVPFLIYSAIGTALWTGLLAASGFWLQENYTLVADSVDRTSKIIIGLIVLIYGWRLLAGGGLGDRVRNWAETLRRDVYAVYLAGRDPRVPWYTKTFVLMIAAYVVSPIDLVPDFIPLLGQVDDVILVPLGILIATRLMPPQVLDEHQRRAAIVAVRQPTGAWVRR